MGKFVLLVFMFFFAFSPVIVVCAPQNQTSGILLGILLSIWPASVWGGYINYLARREARTDCAEDSEKKIQRLTEWYERKLAGEIVDDEDE